MTTAATSASAAGQADATGDAAAKAAADKAAADKATADKAIADKATADKKAADDAAAAAANQPKPPDKYTLKLPDETRLEAEDLTQFEVYARENGMTNDQAQAALEKHHEAIEAQAVRFYEMAKADKDYGGEKLEQSTKHATALLDRVRPKGTPRGDAFRGLLKRTGYGNHPEILAFMADLGKMTDEDPTLGQRPDRSTGNTDMASKLYGHPDSVKLQKETTGGKT